MLDTTQHQIITSAITSLLQHGYTLWSPVNASCWLLGKPEHDGTITPPQRLAIVRAALSSSDGPVLRVTGTIELGIRDADLICAVQPELNIVWLINTAELCNRTYVRLSHYTTLSEACSNNSPTSTLLDTKRVEPTQQPA